MSIIAVCPADQTGLPNSPDLHPPIPSIAHTLTICDKCERQCWIGPHQLAFRVKTGCPVMCYWCLALLGLLDRPMIGLNPDEQSIPRRA